MDDEGSVSEESGKRRKVHGMLKLFYGLNEEGKAPEQPQSLDPCDINGPHFDPELYLNKVLSSYLLGSYRGHHGFALSNNNFYVYRDGGTSAKDLSECVELLLQLDEPAEELCDKFLSHARSRLELDLQGLEAEIKPYPPTSVVKEAATRRTSSTAVAGSPSDNSPKMLSLPSSTPNTDILEFIDRGCNEFVSSLCLVITSYQELFINHAQTGELASKNIPQMANGKLQAFVDDLATCYFLLVERRIQEEKGVGDNSLLVRALDRFHRRLQAVAKLLPGSNVPNQGTEIVIRAATERVKQYLSALQSFYMDSLTDVRQALATPRISVAGASVAGGGAHLGGPASGRDAPNSLPELLSSLSASILNQIKSGEFCSQGVRENLVVNFIRFVCQSSRQFCESAGDKGGSSPPALLLLLSRLCLDFETSTISYILTLTDEQFLVQGLIISQMLRKSVETRDWVNTIEPRNVRAVMKRVVEDTTSIDVQVSL
ncbi:hypothetical protein GOODEAATRI_027811 [Goodea atripinnis]|uniref:Vacuolar protein sorting-associated protein 51 homolog n=1 Tax=Goodea atripinnis TaxID=208336 RepID=A0ABV0MVP9_9TELE